jgi:hypothetical protein
VLLWVCAVAGVCGREKLLSSWPGNEKEEERKGAVPHRPLT